MFEPREHIVKCLADLTRDADSTFSPIHDLMDYHEKENHKALLVYLDKVLNHSLQGSKPTPSYTHIHFESIDETIIPGIFEFLTVKFFLRYFFSNNTDQENSYLNERLEHIDNILRRDLTLNSGVKGGGRDYKKAIEERKALRKTRNFYAQLKEHSQNSGGTFLPKVLLNVLVKDRIQAEDIFKCRPFAIPISEIDPLNLSYVILNSDKNRDGVDQDLNFIEGEDVFEGIEDVIIFNCEGRTIHKGFNMSSLEELNREGTNFKHLFVISFGNSNDQRLNRLISCLDRVENSYYIRPKGLQFSSYLILQDEIERLTDGRNRSKVAIEFIEGDHLLCQILREQLNEYEELYELYSIKMRNVYSLCLGSDIKQIILDEIFSDDIESPTLISTETKRYLLDIEGTFLSELRATLESILEVVLEKSQEYLVQEIISHGPCRILIPSVIFEHDMFMRSIEMHLNAEGENVLSTWYSYVEIYEEKLIILDYRDTGRFPYQIYPNLLELRLKEGQHGIGYFYDMFFQYNYEFTTYEYNKTLVRNILEHPFRQTFFKWDELVSKIKDQKPERQLFDHLWDMENSYEYSSDRETVVINYSNGTKSYWPSQLFVVSDGNNAHLYTDRAEDLYNEFSENGIALKVQPIDELYKDLNLFRTTDQEEYELLQLKKKYDLNEEELEHRLWKVLLKRKADELDKTELYEDLKDRIEQVGTTLVSRDYFENAWMEPKSDSLIPRSKRVFKVLCEYLGLPKVYYAVMLKKRANDRLASRKSTSKMNRLIADMIHEGLFDQESDRIELEGFIKSHDLEEIGMTDESYKEELITLVDLLKPYLDLKEVKKIELK